MCKYKLVRIKVYRFIYNRFFFQRKYEIVEDNPIRIISTYAMIFGFSVTSPSTEHVKALKRIAKHEIPLKMKANCFFLMIDRINEIIKEIINNILNVVPNPKVTVCPPALKPKAAS